MIRMFLLLQSVFLVCSFPTIGQENTAKQAQSQQDQSGQIPVAAFSRLPMHQKAQLSPDGTKVAFVYNFQSPENSVLTVIAIDTGEVSYILETDNIGQSLRWFKWANNKTLIGGIGFAGSRGGTDTTETRLFSVDADEPEIRYLVKPKMDVFNREFKSQLQDRVLDILPDEPDHILVALDLDRPLEPSVFKINIYTNRKVRVSRNRHETRRWLTDRNGEVRLAVSQDYEYGERQIEWLDEDDKWKKLFEYNALEDSPIEPIGFGAQNHILYYRAYQDDKKKLFKINTKSNEVIEVFSDPDYDFDGSLIYSLTENKVIGISHSDEKRGRIYWDEERTLFVNQIDTALPKSNNYLVDVSDDENRYIVYSESDNSPGIYYVGDRKRKQLSVLLHSYPGLNDSQFNLHQLVKFKARDDLTIEGLLTLPKQGTAPFPTVIHPHGGPANRDLSGFDIWTAFFNSRGYAVFRPNFRGSKGFGLSFSESRYEGWGTAMQDDITDGTKWLIDQNIADPDKICIVGASYGGYAALMGVVKTPELFQCAVSFGGVMDLPYMVQKSTKYVGNKFVKKQLGTDSVDLKSRSPAYNAEKINVPVLLAHGEDDRIVDVENSRNMYKALKAEDKDVQFIELENGSHYLSIQANRHRFFNAMDEFLKQHLNKESTLTTTN